MSSPSCAELVQSLKEGAQPALSFSGIESDQARSKQVAYHGKELLVVMRLSSWVRHVNGARMAWNSASTYMSTCVLSA